MKQIAWLMMLSVGLMTGAAGVAKAEEDTPTYPALFEEVCQIVEANFYDRAFIQSQFPSLKAEYQEQLAAVTAPAEFSAMVNAMLSAFHTSHTYYLSPRDYEYYHLAAVFGFLPAIQQIFQGQEIRYPTVGLITETIEGQTFIAAVLAGSIAEQAGLLAGDEIVTVNGAAYQPIESLNSDADPPVEFTIRRIAGGDLLTFTLTPMRLNPKLEMLAAEKASIRVIERQGHRIGYIHIYSYAGQEYQDELTAAIAWGAFKDADALIIDLRYGLGGADPTYLNIFNPDVPVITWTDKDGNTGSYDAQWRKPAALLVNHATRSGKEILAFGAQKYHLAAVIGERTAGAVLGASVFPVSNGDFLYLAGRSSLIDGVNLEGVGVTPDIEVPLDIRYSNGQDAQLERALEYVLGTL